MNESLFQPDNNQQQMDQNKNYFSELVGEGKKFKDQEALARGKAEADNYVASLTSELDTLRQDYLKLREDHMAGAKLEQLIDQLNKQQQRNADDYTPPVGEVKQKPELNLEEVKKSVLDDLKREKVLEEERNNLASIQEKLKERFGNNAQNILKQQRDALKMTQEQVDSLARQAPAAFMRLMGLDEKPTETFQAPPSSTQRSEFSPTTQKRTWSWWQNLKRESPSKYWDPKAISQRHKDAMDLGDAFNDGDAEVWHRLGNPTLRYN